MKRVDLTEVAGIAAGAVLGLLLAFQASAQGQSGGARPGGVTGGAVNAGGFGNTRIGVERGWPRGPEVQAPSRLPQDKAFGQEGEDASAKKAANASSAASTGAQGNAAAEAGCVKAKSAIALAGTGGATGSGKGGEAGGEGRTTAAAAVCAGTGAEVPGDATEAPGHTGLTGLAQATLRADEHAETGLEQAQGNQEKDDASDNRNHPEAPRPR